MLDEQAADVVADPPGGQPVEAVVGDLRCDGELSREVGDVALLDSGQAASRLRLVTAPTASAVPARAACQQPRQCNRHPRPA